MDNVINVSDTMMIAGLLNYKNGDSKYNTIFMNIGYEYIFERFFFEKYIDT